MKHRITRALALLLALLLLLLAGCADGGGPSGPETPEEFDHLAEAEQILRYLLDGDFAAALTLADESIEDQVSESLLEFGWQSETGTLGAFVEIEDNALLAQGDDTLVQLLLQFEGGQAVLTLIFTPQDTYSTIFVNRTGDENAESIKNPLPDGAAEIEVTLHAGTGMELGGALVLPAGYDENTPVVVMAQGSGPSDRDETIGPNKPFRDIAYGFAANGIASIRYDKLTYAHPELFATSDYTAELEYGVSVMEALRVARAQAGLGDAYLLGHSLGGMLTPWLIAQSDGGFAGGLILAGSPRPLWEISYDQNMQLLAGSSDGQPPQEYVDWIEEELEKAARLSSMSEEELLEETVFGLPAYYLQQMAGNDAIALAIQNDVPLMILHGEADFQVTLEQDFSAWQEGLAPMGDKVLFVQYPGLNHLFMPGNATIENYVEVYNTPMLVDAQVIQDMTRWIQSQTPNA